MTPWRPLFEVTVRHAYYAPAPVPALRWEPTAASARRLARAGIVLRPTATGVVAYADAQRLGALQAQMHDTVDPFVVTLAVRCGDTEFASTTLGLPPAGGDTPRVWLFDSQRAGPPDSDGWQALQHGPQAGADDTAALDAPPLAEELSAADRRVPPHFVVRLVLTPETEAEAEAAPPPGRRFRVTLAARATHWKYLLPTEWESQQPQVVDVDARTEFTAPVREPLDDGRDVLAARSREPIALQRRYAQRFQVHALTPVADRVLVRRLPVPTPGALRREAVNGGAAPVEGDAAALLVSEIHVLR
jgi:hypothetical protein